MLLLTRKIEQGFRIFDETGRFIGHVKVLEFPARGRVKLGIEADSRFTILRDELTLGTDAKVSK